MDGAGAALSAYQYDALPQPQSSIRLLKILRGPTQRGDQLYSIQCKISTWYLNDPEIPKFRAISYTWGDATFLTPILLNKETKDHILLVSKNCEQALRQAWLFDKKSWYWFDSICIDQSNLGEKGPQVSLMGEVYGRAECVIACVGDHSDDSEELFRVARVHSDFLSRIRSRHLQALDSYEHDPDAKQLRPAWGESYYQRFRAFLTRPYFQRLWIYQELYLAKQVELCCEGDHISIALLDGLAFGGVIFGFRHDQDLPPARHLLEVGAASGGRKTSLWKLLEHVGGMGSQCRDARDRCFGVLAMVDWEGHKPIIPDYNKDKFEVAEELFRTIADTETEGHEAVDCWFEIGLGIGDLLELWHEPPTPGFTRAIEHRRTAMSTLAGPWKTSRGQTRKTEGNYGFRLRRDHTGWNLGGRECRCTICSSTHIPDNSTSLEAMVDPGSRTILPKGAEAGDWCIPFGTGPIYGHIMLVARESNLAGQRHVLELVGLGIWGREYCPNLGLLGLNHQASFELTLHSEDFFFLLCAANTFFQFTTFFQSSTDDRRHLYWDAICAQVFKLISTRVCKSGFSFAEKTGSWGVMMDAMRRRQKMVEEWKERKEKTR